MEDLVTALRDSLLDKLRDQLRVRFKGSENLQMDNTGYNKLIENLDGSVDRKVLLKLFKPQNNLNDSTLDVIVTALDYQDWAEFVRKK